MTKTPRCGKTGIEYLDYGWNFFSGCWNWNNGKCPLPMCWAHLRSLRFKEHYPNGFEPTIYPEALLSPLNIKKPSRIGVAWMGDLIGYADPEQQFNAGYSFQKQVMIYRPDSLKNIIYEVIKATPQHTYLFLTKCPENLPKWEPFPDNALIGVSVFNDDMLKSAFDALYKIPKNRTYLSIEPLLSRINCDVIEASKYYRWLDWLTIGQQTPVRKSTMPEIEWIQEIVEAADKAGIPVFLKDNLNSCEIADYPILLDSKGNLRQEFPVNNSKGIIVDEWGDTCESEAFEKIKERLEQISGAIYTDKKQNQKA